MILRKICFFTVITSIVMKVKSYSISNYSVKRTIKSQLPVITRQGEGFSSGAKDIPALDNVVTRKSTRIRNNEFNLSDHIKNKQSKIVTTDTKEIATSKKTEKLSIESITTSVNKSNSSSFWDINEILQESKFFSSSSTWTDWLSEHHSTVSHVWIKIAKLHSNIPSVSRKDALQVALCYGWIDGVCKSLDDVYFLQRYTPRRKNSNWSLVNKNFTAELIAKGLMRESGFKAIEAAKADGRWNKNNK